jgi:hypothetical protein
LLFGLVADCCDRGNEPSGFMKGKDISLFVGANFSFSRHVAFPVCLKQLRVKQAYGRNEASGMAILVSILR